MRRGLDWITIALFLLALCAPAVDQCLRPDAERDCRTAEQRRPEPRPPLPRRLVEAGTFPRRYESHYMDTFGLRDVLLRWNSLEQWLGLGVLPARSFEPGREGWCFYAQEDSPEIHRGLKPFTAGELEAWVQCLRQRRDALARRGAKYLFVLCPNKETIYAEYAPAAWKPLGPTRLEQLCARLEREPDLPFLDLRPALLAAKAEDRTDDWLYTPLGTHWNGRGTYAAYDALLARLQRDFPDLARVRREDFERSEPEGRQDGVGLQMYSGERLSEPIYALTPSERGFEELVHSPRGQGARMVTRKEVDAPRLVWLHDSFGPYLFNLVCEAFASVETRHVHLRDGLREWAEEHPADGDGQAGPDLVLETFVERVLAGPVPEPLDAAGASAPAERFEQLSEVLWRDGREGDAPGSSLGGATVERRAQGLFLQREGLRDGLLLPALEAAADAPVWLRLDAHCRFPTEVDVFVRPAGAPLFLPRDRVSLVLGPEVATAVARLPFLGSPFEVLLRPRPPASELVIEGLEVRREQAPADR